VLINNMTAANVGANQASGTAGGSENELHSLNK
jgi:hypothetical protein